MSQELRRTELAPNEIVLGYGSEPIDEVVGEMLRAGATGFFCDTESGANTRLAELKSFHVNRRKLLTLSMTALVPSGEADMIFEIGMSSTKELEGAQQLIADVISRSTKCERYKIGLEAVLEECFLNLREHVFDRKREGVAARVQIYSYPDGIWLLCRDSLGKLELEGLKAAYSGRRGGGEVFSVGGYGLAVMLSHGDTVVAGSRPGVASVVAVRFRSAKSKDGGTKSLLLWSDRGD